MEDENLFEGLTSTTILSAQQIEAMIQMLRKESLLAGLPQVSSAHVEDTLRYGPVRSMFQQRREERGLSIRDVSLALKLPQYRLKAVEGSGLAQMLPSVFRKYSSYLELDSWVSRWAAANPELASRLEIDGEV